MFGNNSRQNLIRKSNDLKIKMALEESMRAHGISPKKYRETLGRSFPESPSRQQKQQQPQQQLTRHSGTLSEYSPEVLFLSHTQARRTYKVCTYIEGLGRDKLGVEYSDAITGQLLFRIPSSNSKHVHNDLILFDSRAAAISAANRVLTKLPRVLVGFDCWGGVKRKVRDFPSSLYEHSRVVTILEHLGNAKFGTKLPKWDEIGAERLAATGSGPREPPPPLQKFATNKFGTDQPTGSIHDKKAYNRNQDYQATLLQTKINLPGNCNQHLA